MQSESDMQVLYSADNTAHNITRQDTTSLYIGVLYINALNCKALHSTRYGMTSLFSTALYCTMQHTIWHHSTLLYGTVLYRTAGRTSCAQVHCQGHVIHPLLSAISSREAMTKRVTKMVITFSRRLYRFSLYPCWNSVRMRIVDPRAR